MRESVGRCREGDRRVQGGAAHWVLEVGYVTLKGDIIIKSPISYKFCPDMSLAARYDLNI